MERMREYCRILAMELSTWKEYGDVLDGLQTITDIYEKETDSARMTFVVMLLVALVPALVAGGLLSVGLAAAFVFVASQIARPFLWLVDRPERSSSDAAVTVSVVKRRPVPTPVSSLSCSRLKRT